jgi:hypothetical protein
MGSFLELWTSFLTFRRSHDRAFLDAVATDIIHQHSGRLDYYKGYFSNFDPRLPLLRRTVATSPSSTRQNLSESETCGASTMHRWTIASICRLSSIIGGTVPTAPPRHSPKLRFPRRSVAAGSLQLPAYPNCTTQLPELSPPVAEETENFQCMSFLTFMGYHQLLHIIMKFPRNGEDFSALAPALGSNIRIRSCKNNLESCQFRRRPRLASCHRGIQWCWQVYPVRCVLFGRSI